MKQNSRIQLENTLIGALGVLSLVLFILSFLPGLGLANRVGILLEMGHMVQRAFSVVLFILTFQLWKRKRAAWNIAVLLLFLSFLRGLTALSSPLYLPFHLAEAVLFLLFGRTSAARLTGAASDALSCFCCWHWQASSSMPVSAIIFR
jgi:phosphatidylglycerol lysyltransferase